MGSADKLFTDGEAYEHPYPRPLSGGKVEHLPSALLPARTALIGRYVTLEPLDAARHASDLFEASHGSKAALRIWDYLPWGPWKSEAEFANVLRQQTAGQDRVYYAIRGAAGEKACGQICFLDIQPEQGVIEIGGIWFGLTLRRTGTGRKYSSHQCKFDRYQPSSKESELRSSHELRTNLLPLELAASNRCQQRVTVSHACRIHRRCACQTWTTYFRDCGTRDHTAHRL